MAEYFRFRCALAFARIGSQSNVTPQSVFRDGRKAAALQERLGRCAAPAYPSKQQFHVFQATPLSLLFTFHSRYSIRYRTWACIWPWMRNTTRIHTTLSSSTTTPASARGPTRVALFGPAGSTALCPRCNARPQLEFRPGTSLFARRYWGNLALISFPGLTDMLKFGPQSRTAQVACCSLQKKGPPPSQLDQLCTVRGLAA
ncbi:Hypothetical_protein [Hexamita inflata]|uniref:Hypothetical_protein n=1 Tax=Hexamita inflata TaxID=28002 RepID=A0AA86PJD3_9EUKA|nr:Hypothetical protein HINF_LOCUS28279 [Hexamita inflata]